MNSLRPITSRRHPGAFTLIELLTVIAIIAILAALLLQTAGYVQEKSGRSRAEAEIAALESALESYKIDNGAYPDGDGGDKSSKALITALNPSDTTKKVYFEIPAKMLAGYDRKTSYGENLTAANYLIDPFGNPYYYEYPGDIDRSGTNFFDLWSVGKQKSKSNPNEAKYIKNW